MPDPPVRPDPDEDARLVERAKEGDREAFEQLVRRHLKSARGVALSKLGHRQDAQDVCQESFLRALENIERCGEPRKFRGWLLTIVRRIALDRLKREAHRDHESLDSMRPTWTREQAEDPAVRQERREEIEQALQRLSARQRKILILYDYEGWSHREVARKMGIEEGTSRYHLHEARRRMRLALNGKMP